jgi:NAD(P)-dependent dehydrogenase (short-subunit alcohol dehydrogenase family)
MEPGDEAHDGTHEEDGARHGRHRWHWTRDTSDGLESNFAVNHLAPYLLTRLLLEPLALSPQARIITVASEGHRSGTLDFEDLGLEKGYAPMRSCSRALASFTCVFVGGTGWCRRGKP